jgi:hypothetical protein
MRMLALLRSMAPRDSARTDLAVLRFIFLGLAVLVLAWSRWIAAANALSLGPLAFAAFSYLSLMLALFLGARLAADSAGDVRTGLLEMVFLAGLEPRQWLGTRTIQMWAGFLSVWIVRAPLLFFTFTLGGVTVEQVVTTELMLLTVFFIVSSLGLLASFAATSRQQVYGRGFLSLVVWEVLLITPGFFANLIAAFAVVPIRPGVLNSTAAIAELGLI